MSARRATRDLAEVMLQWFHEHQEERHGWQQLLHQWDLPDTEGVRNAFKLCRELADRDEWFIPKAVGAKGNTYILTRRAPEMFDSQLALVRQEVGTTRLRRQHDRAILRDTTGLTNAEIALLEGLQTIDLAAAQMHDAIGGIAQAMVADRRAARIEAEAAASI